MWATRPGFPGIIDTHVHVTLPVGFAYSDVGERFECNGKQGALEFKYASKEQEAQEAQKSPGT